MRSSYSDLHPRKICGRYSYNYLQGYAFNVDWEAGVVGDISALTVYLRFVSDDTVHYTGFNVTFIAASRRGR